MKHPPKLDSVDANKRAAYFIFKKSVKLEGGGASGSKIK